jgi:hypothetical protein
MAEDRDNRVDDVVDTNDVPVDEEHREEQRRDEERIRESNTQRTSVPDQLEPLFEKDEAKQFRARWLAIQGKFVDDPRASVKEADDLVAEVIKSVTMNFSNRRVGLEKQWNSGEKASTEDLRMAIKRYRSFFDRLLTLES